MVTGHRYLWRYIGDREAEGSWLDAKVKGRTESLAILSGVAQNHPQFAYAGLQKTPTGVGIRAESDPGSRQLLWTS